jgi:stage III sporulation protein SpoIIIAA
MQIVFATGQPGQLHIDTVATRDLLPRGARVLATCSGRSLVELLDRTTFHAMTNNEFYALQVTITKARLLESERRRPIRNKVMGRLLRRLRSR